MASLSVGRAAMRMSGAAISCVHDLAEQGHRQNGRVGSHEDPVAQQPAVHCETDSGSATARRQATEEMPAAELDLPSVGT